MSTNALTSVARCTVPAPYGNYTLNCMTCRPRRIAGAGQPEIWSRTAIRVSRAQTAYEHGIISVCIHNIQLRRCALTLPTHLPNTPIRSSLAFTCTKAGLTPSSPCISIFRNEIDSHVPSGAPTSPSCPSTKSISRCWSNVNPGPASWSPMSPTMVDQRLRSV